MPAPTPTPTTGHNHPALHPWGQPFPVGHPDHRPTRRQVAAAASRWFVYATVLTIAAVVVALVVVGASFRPRPSTAGTPASVTVGGGQLVVAGEAGSGDSFTPFEGDTSSYHGPAFDHQTRHHDDRGEGRS